MFRLYSVLRTPIAMIVGVLILNYSNPIYALSMDDLVKRDGLFFEKFTTTPFTGEVDKGLFQGAISNGLKEGEWFAFHENGQLRNQSSWRNGKKQDNWISYHDNGQRDEIGKYNNGVRVGVWIGYHATNGQKAYEGEYLDAGFNCRHSLNCDDGIKIGSWITYWDNGQIREELEYNGGKLDGIAVGYGEDGRPTYRGVHVNGLRDGFWEFFVDGKPVLFMSGYYKNGKKVSD